MVARPAPPGGRPAAAPVDLLLIGHDPTLARLVAGLVEASGTGRPLAWAPTVAAARPLLAAGARCVLLDLDLADHRGDDDLRALVALAPDTAVIALTGRDDDEARGARAVADGAQDFLERDRIDARLLDRSVRYAVERKRAATAGRLLRATRLRAEENLRLERGLLPRPQLATDRLRCLTLYEPGGDQALLGGDFYDVIGLADGRARAVIGDVAGHGPDEAALGVRLRVAWRALVLAGADGPVALGALQTLLLAEHPGPEVFATLCDVEVAAGGRVATVARAGHQPPLLVTERAATPLQAAGGPPLGVVEGAAFPPTRIALPPVWALLCYTDGLVENLVRGEGPGERLGDDGLARLVTDHLRSGHDLDRIVTVDLAALRDDRPDRHADDVAVVALATPERP